MILTSICLTALLAVPQQSKAYATQRTGAAQAQTESVLVNVGTLNPQQVLPLLKQQFKDLGDVQVKDNCLLIQGSKETIQSVHEALALFEMGQRAPSSFLPNPKEAIPLRDENGVRSLGSVFEDYVTQAGLLCMMDSDTEGLVYSIQPKILGTKVLEPHNAAALLQNCLAQEGFALNALPSKLGHALRLSGPRSQVHPMLVNVERLGAYASDQALQIQALVSLPSTDIRSTSNVLRQLVLRPNQQRIVPMGSSNQMLIQGSGAWVHQIAKALILSDHANRKQVTAAREKTELVTDVIRLSYADPKDILFHLEKFFPPTTQGKPRITTSIDPRLNAIILRCSKSDHTEIKDLIARLDVK